MFTGMQRQKLGFKISGVRFNPHKRINIESHYGMINTGAEPKSLNLDGKFSISY